MLKQCLLTVAALAVATSASAQQCLHGRSESPAQQARREKAIEVAHAINAAEVVVVGPQKPKYRRPEELTNILTLPPGFALQFNTDGTSYSFSIKDTLDACHFAIFSDQEKLVYEAVPMMNARVVPLTTR